MSCGVGQRRDSDLALLWLWCRPAASAPIQPLAWEPPNAMAVAPKRQKKKKKRKKEKKKIRITDISWSHLWSTCCNLHILSGLPLFNTICA